MLRTSRLFIPMLIFVMISCNVKEKADLIIYNAKLYIIDEAFSTRQAFAVRSGKIIATGSNEEILGKYQSDNMLDAGEKPVYPGFIDGHCHFQSYAMGLHRNVDLRGTASFDEILQILKEHHEKYPGSWILGRGWDQNDWQDKTFPDNSRLDQEFPGVPVLLSRVDGHAVLASSETLKRAGITADTKVEGGQVMLKDGKMTGILLDNATDLLFTVIPDADEKMKKEALIEAQYKCFAAGLTSVTDAGLGKSAIDLIDSLQQSGALKMRVNAMISGTGQGIDAMLDKGPYHTDRLNVCSIKLYADGALGSRGALLKQPYSDDPGNYGLLISHPEYFKQILVKAYESGFQVNTHCIGDSANRLMLNLYGEILKGQNDRRWRIEHAQVVDPEDVLLFGKYSIIPSIQATHCTSDMPWAWERLGPERVKWAYAWRPLLQQNGWLINGTDFPVEEIYPLLTFYASITRQDTEGHPEGGFQPENLLNREEALRSITIWAAKGSFEEKEKGSIEPGKFADFIILDNDIMTADPSAIPGIKVLKTYLNGELVFEAK